MFGEKGYILVKELAQCEDNLPCYNNDLVKDVSNEITTLIKQNVEDARPQANDTIDTSNMFSTMLIRHAAVKRNIRCLMAYHYDRLQRLRKMRWEFGSMLPTELRGNLSVAEVDWFSQYSQHLANYMRSIGEDGLNLATDLKPPKSLYIQVSCLVDYGKFELEDGSVVCLKKNSRHLLPRNQCEELVRQGILEHLG